MTPITTGIARLKEAPLTMSPEALASRVRNLFASKGYPKTSVFSQEDISRLLARLCLKTQQSTVDQLLPAVTHALSQRKVEQIEGEDRYSGTTDQNGVIDAAMKRARDDLRYLPERRSPMIGEGVSTCFDVATPEISHIIKKVGDTPITIVGGGVSGLMLAKALVNYGWNESALTIIDKSGVFGGIWNYDHVAGLSRNNPKKLEFLGRVLEPAPGTGEEISDFVHSLQHGSPFISPPMGAQAIRIAPGHLKSTVEYTIGKEKASITSPIVINALGLGKPRDPNRPGHMTTNTKKCGFRWQKSIRDDPAKYQDAHFVLIGLGNSTAEMLVQLHELQDRGVNVDYKVITHYPVHAVYMPEDVFHDGNRSYLVFRDLEKPNLVDYAGDIAPLREAYFRALHNGDIISDITHWDNNGATIRARRATREIEVPCTHLGTLIGYHHTPESLERWGILPDDSGYARRDFDGEMHKNPGKQRPLRCWKGYFGYGPIIESAENPNAIVIPGNIYRLGDLMFSIAMRAAEAKKK